MPVAQNGSEVAVEALNSFTKPKRKTAGEYLKETKNKVVLKEDPVVLYQRINRSLQDQIDAFEAFITEKDLWDEFTEYMEDDTEYCPQCGFPADECHGRWVSWSYYDPPEYVCKHSKVDPDPERIPY